ncbi:universal stress protein [Lysobacter sp. TY2-98]|uniref:universal stress protein n=1 Tax=Lysobacter sp. TY2-98 TaxID=2290922 RepID=UPI000E201A54|nr:universal stress protein [Lysobacter sp. TY2-98]AXK71042.1 universal stress protein [Lysobacter sp. TY2-98]
MLDVLVRSTSADGSGFDVEIAARVAASFRGSLTAVHVVPMGLLPLAPYDPGMLDAAATLEAERLVEEAEKNAPAFSAWASSLGVRNAVWMASAGDATHVMSRIATWHDLYVTQRSSRDDDWWARPAGVARIVLSNRLPTLIVPAGTDPARLAGTVAVAWNGTPGAARALHGARAFVEHARDVVVLVGNDRRAAEVWPTVALPPWLARHRPNARIRQLGDIGDGGEPTGAALLSAAREEQADLLVTGAYGHTRFSEWILGGVTRHLLEHAPLPMVMRH